MDNHQPQNGHLHLNDQTPSPTSSRKDKGSPSHSRRNASTTKTSRTKGVPQSFGYIKRPNGTTIMSPQEQVQHSSSLMGVGRTAHVSAVPRSNKVKVSGGTQTTTADFSQSKIIVASQRSKHLFLFLFQKCNRISTEVFP
jgi:hypothetical protein